MKLLVGRFSDPAARGLGFGDQCVEFFRRSSILRLERDGFECRLQWCQLGFDAGHRFAKQSQSLE